MSFLTDLRPAMNTNTYMFVAFVSLLGLAGGDILSSFVKDSIAAISTVFNCLVAASILATVLTTLSLLRNNCRDSDQHSKFSNLKLIDRTTKDARRASDTKVEDLQASLDQLTRENEKLSEDNRIWIAANRKAALDRDNWKAEYQNLYANHAYRLSDDEYKRVVYENRNLISQIEVYRSGKALKNESARVDEALKEIAEKNQTIERQVDEIRHHKSVIESYRQRCEEVTKLENEKNELEESLCRLDQANEKKARSFDIFVKTIHGMFEKGGLFQTNVVCTLNALLESGLNPDELQVDMGRFLLYLEYERKDMGELGILTGGLRARPPMFQDEYNRNFLTFIYSDTGAREAVPIPSITCASNLVPFGPQNDFGSPNSSTTTGFSASTQSNGTSYRSSTQSYGTTWRSSTQSNGPTQITATGPPYTPGSSPLAPISNPAEPMAAPNTYPPQACPLATVSAESPITSRSTGGNRAMNEAIIKSKNRQSFTGGNIKDDGQAMNAVKHQQATTAMNPFDQVMYAANEQQAAPAMDPLDDGMDLESTLQATTISGPSDKAMSSADNLLGSSTAPGLNSSTHSAATTQFPGLNLVHLWPEPTTSMAAAPNSMLNGSGSIVGGCGGSFANAKQSSSTAFSKYRDRTRDDDDGDW